MYRKCIATILNYMFQNDAIIGCKFDVHYSCRAR